MTETLSAKNLKRLHVLEMYSSFDLSFKQQLINYWIPSEIEIKHSPTNSNRINVMNCIS